MAKPENISLVEFADRWKTINEPGFGWAFYRLPGNMEVNFMRGKVSQSSVDQIGGDGFIIAPFKDQAERFWHIENTHHFRLINTGLSSLDADFTFFNADSKTANSSTQQEYEKLVSDVIAEIEKGNLQKAVPARAKMVELKTGFLLFELYESLLSAYPNAFVYMLSTPQTGTWIGCTPEKLLKADHNHINTMSLAGTMKIIAAPDKGFTAKEIEEQAIVTRYIHTIFKKYCSEIEMKGPETIKAGNIYHLATYIKGDLMPEFYNNKLQILKDLHPTPAVCGMPLEASRDFLLAHENFDRSLYSGFLGPISTNSADIFVNLRCMQVFNNYAVLYAGAGVVAGSVPENEWLETEEKMKTLLRFL